MKNILVTTDLSEHSRVAFPIARKIAEATQAKLHLLALKENLLQTAMIYSMDVPICPDPSIEERMHARLASQLEEIRTTAFGNLKPESHLLEATGPIHYEILQFAASKAIDLIVMATHGRSGISRLLIGSVTERVVRESACPVLTVPARTVTTPTS